MSLRPTYSRHPHRGLRLTTAPATEPVSVDELRTYTVTDSTSLPDAEANGLIEEARQWIEDKSGLALINQTWTVAYDNWPGYREPWWDGVRQGAISELHVLPMALALPRYPLSSVTSVTTYDEAGNATAVTVANVFDVDTYSIPGRLALKSGQTWPVALRPTNAIIIAFVAGYGAASPSVPAPLRGAVTRLAAYVYDHKGACDMGGAYAASGAEGIVSGYMRARL